MANDRMVLCHRPTGIGMILSKHHGWGWYGTPCLDTSYFFQTIDTVYGYGINDGLETPHTEDEAQRMHDDFVLLFESQPGWHLGEAITDGTRHLYHIVFDPMPANTGAPCP